MKKRYILFVLILVFCFTMMSGLVVLGESEDVNSPVIGEEFAFGYSGIDIAAAVKWIIMEEQGGNYVLLSKDCLTVSSFYNVGNSKYADGSNLFNWLNGEKYNDFYNYFSKYEQQYIKPISVANVSNHNVQVSIPTEAEIKKWYPLQSDRVAFYNETESGRVETDYWVLSASDLKNGIETGKGTVIDANGRTKTKDRSENSTACVRVKIVADKEFIDKYGNTGVDKNNNYLLSGRGGINESMADECFDLSFSAFSQYSVGDIIVYGWEVADTHYDSTFTGAMYKKVNRGKTDYCFAFRGSNSVSDVLADAMEIGAGVSGSYMYGATDWVKQKIDEIIAPDIDNVGNIYITGHSLGAYTAAFVSSSILDLRLLSKEYPKLTGDEILDIEKAKQILDASILSSNINLEQINSYNEVAPAEEESDASVAVTDEKQEVDLSLFDLPERLEEILTAVSTGKIDVETASRRIQSEIYASLSENISPGFEKLFGTGKEPMSILASIRFYNQQIIPRLYCYAYSTPGATPLSTADSTVVTHFEHNKLGIYDNHIANYYINGDAISSFGSHFGQVEQYNADYNFANSYNYHLLSNFYYFKPMEDLLKARGA